VIEARPVGSAQRFVLPGQTAAWHASTIYARVNGFVGKWFADIGDMVHKGQVLALIETPDLDAQLTAARAQLNAANAQVSARKAEAEFAKTTFDRWRDSPKGVEFATQGFCRGAQFPHQEWTARMPSVRGPIAQATVTFEVGDYVLMVVLPFENDARQQAVARTIADICTSFRRQKV